MPRTIRLEPLAHMPDPNADRPPSANDPTGTALPSGAELAPGVPPTRIGRYLVRRLLGEGAFGRVWRAFDPDLHREVAIKVPHPHGLTPAFRERFVREARASATIHHPNVCPIYDVGVEGEVPYIVMHFVAGGTLAGVLDRRGTPFPPRQAAAIARKLALGVAAAHAKGVIHRDLKPGNVLWDEVHREVLVTDFGLARIAGEAQLSRTGDILGTPAYMSPEQARGKQVEVGPLSDVYSLGVILYRLLTGELPFQGSAMEVLAQAQFTESRPPSEVLPGLDPALDAVCLRAMAKSPDARPPSARAFADALTQALGVTGDELSELPDLGAGDPASGASTTTRPGALRTQISGGSSFRSQEPTLPPAASPTPLYSGAEPTPQPSRWSRLARWLLIRLGALAAFAGAVALYDLKLVLPLLFIVVLGYIALHFAMSNADE